MSQAIAVLNAGSSSIKFSLFTQDGDDLSLTVRGQAEGHPYRAALCRQERQRRDPIDPCLGCRYRARS